MSLIGPRPLLPQDQPPNAAVRLSVRPGITGWAQVNERRQIVGVREGCAGRLVHSQRFPGARPAHYRDDVCQLAEGRSALREGAGSSADAAYSASAGRARRAGRKSIGRSLAPGGRRRHRPSRLPRSNDNAVPVTVSLCSSERSTPIWQGRAGISDEQEICLRRAGPRMQPASRSAARRIIFIIRFFFADYSATSQILTDLALHLSGCGHDVHVVTSRQRYDDPNALLPRTQSLEGVSVHRIATTRFGRSV